MQHRSRWQSLPPRSRQGAWPPWAVAYGLVLAATACGDSFTNAGPTGGAGGSGGTGGAPNQCLEPYPDPPGGDCPVECAHGCINRECDILCESGGSCIGQTRQCPPGFDCVVICNAANPCAGATIECPPAQRCAIECRGTDACVDVVVHCGSGPCSLLCDGSTSSHLCTGATLECGVERCELDCPQGDVEPPPTMLNCDASCRCIDGC